MPPRVWSRLIDALRTRGLVVEGIGSFDMDELRVIRKGCSYPLTPLLFFHSVGDLQRACHANEVSMSEHAGRRCVVSFAFSFHLCYRGLPRGLIGVSTAPQVFFC